MKAYESAFALSFNDDAGARQISHDTVIRNTGRARRSGVHWSYYEPAGLAQALLRSEGSDIELPADIAELCERFPTAKLVIATVEVDPAIAP